MHIDPALLTPVALLLGTLVGGSASLLGAIYSQRFQGRVQRVASEIAKRLLDGVDAGPMRPCRRVCVSNDKDAGGPEL